MFKKIWRRFFSAKRPFKLTKAGWVFILYTIGVGAGAINTGNNLLYLVFGVFLGMILASGFLSDLSLWGLAVDWTFPHAAEAGQPVAILLRIINLKKWVPSLSVSVGMDGTLGGQFVSVRVYVPFISATQTVSARLEFTPERRGWFQKTGLRLYTRYPFALLEKWWRLRGGEAIKETYDVDDGENGFFVTPKKVPVRIHEVPTTAFNDLTSIESAERGDGTTFFGIRSFNYGDNPRRIHWKSSAKQPSELLIKEMEREQAFDVLLRAPEPEDMEAWTEFEIENFVSYLASLIIGFEAEGHRTHLFVADRVVIAPDEFLSIWNPQRKLDEITSRWVADVKQVMLKPGAREVECLPAYHAWRKDNP